MTVRLWRPAFVSFAIIVLVASQLTAQPPTAEESINRDRIARKRAVVDGRPIAGTPKWGFFGTIFHLILEQVNDTKSAYNQISDLVNNQFTNDNAKTPMPEINDSDTNGTTETPKISRAEFLRILDRNLKGLRRLRDLEWREAWKDTRKNIMGYKNEAFSGKNNGR